MSRLLSVADSQRSEFPDPRDWFSQIRQLHRDRFTNSQYCSTSLGLLKSTANSAKAIHAAHMFFIDAPMITSRGECSSGALGGFSMQQYSAISREMCTETVERRSDCRKSE